MLYLVFYLSSLLNLKHKKMLFQITVTDSLSTVQSAATSEISLSWWEMALKGGWIMIPIAVLSAIAVFIFFDRYLAIRKAQKVDVNFMDRIKEYIHEGRIDSAIAMCKNDENPVSKMILKGLSRIGHPLNDVSTAIENVGKLEIYKLEKNLPTLASVAGAAPMIGFLGTVIGMIRAFYDMSQVAGGNVNIQLLSDGIYTAMVTTVAGLLVGIVAYLAYNMLVAKVEKVVFSLEATTIDFMDLLNEPAK